MLQQLEPVPKRLVCDGKQRKQSHGSEHPAEKPNFRTWTVASKKGQCRNSVQGEIDGLQTRNPCQGHSGEQRIFEPQRGKELDEEGEKILAHPKVLDVGDDFVHHTQPPEKRPKHENGAANQSMFLHGASFVEM